jgi:hypothetical protein
MVRGSYHFTRAGIVNCQQHEITPEEVWEVVNSGERVFLPVGIQSRLVAGQTRAGRWIGFLARESAEEPDMWDIVAVRELGDPEIENVRQMRGDRDA